MMRKEYLGAVIIILVGGFLSLLIVNARPAPSSLVGYGHGHEEVSRKDHDEDNGHGHDHDGQLVSRGNHDREKGHGDEHAQNHDRRTASLAGHKQEGGQGHDHDVHGHSLVKGFIRGPQGGRLFKDGDFAVEVAIHEKDGPPRFRLYCYEHDRQLDPRDVGVSLDLVRLGNRKTRFRFRPHDGYLHSDQVVKEPHSFDVTVSAERDGKVHRWQFSQVEARITLSSEVAQRMGISARTAGPERIRSELELPGEIVLNTDRVCHIVPRVSGVVSDATKNLGDTVKRGEIIAVIDSRALADARSNYLVRLKHEELARINYDRISKLWQKKVSAEKEYLDALKAFEEAKIERIAAGQKLLALGLTRKELKTLPREPEGPLTGYELRAPFAGTVIIKRMSKGQWVDENAEILCVADLSTVWGDLTIYADKLDQVRLGQRVKIKSDSTDLEAEGVVSYIGPLVGEQSRTAKARVVIDNRHGRWRPGMFVTARVVRAEDMVPIAIRKEALQTLDRFGTVVFVQDGDQFEPRPVEMGRSDGQNVEVVAGLSPGEKYVAKKSFVLKSQLGTAGLSHTH